MCLFKRTKTGVREYHRILHISIEDIQVTVSIREAGKLLDIELLDHIIVGNPRWISLKERGQGFNK
jgi:hypothetical protein